MNITSLFCKPRAWSLFWCFALLLLCGFGLSPASAQVIAGAECFVDTDPGLGNGIHMQAVDGAFDERIEEVTADIAMSDMDIGFHTVYVRFRDESGNWSIAKPYGNDLRISRSNVRIMGKNTITQAEYFIDGDPGAGSGLALQAWQMLCDDSGCSYVADPFDAKQELLYAEADLVGLSPGNHTIGVRIRDANGRWGPARSFPFQVYAAPRIVAAEFFVDEDPGKGSGVSLLKGTECWERVGYDLLAEYPDQEKVGIGAHEVFARFQNQYGFWGLTNTEGVSLDIVQDLCEGDFDDDGDVDGTDLSTFAADFGRTDCEEGSACEGDFDGDGDVDGSDLSTFSADFGRTECPQSTP